MTLSPYYLFTVFHWTLKSLSLLRLWNQFHLIPRRSYWSQFFFREVNLWGQNIFELPRNRDRSYSQSSKNIQNFIFLFWLHIFQIFYRAKIFDFPWDAGSIQPKIHLQTKYPFQIASKSSSWKSNHQKKRKSYLTFHPPSKNCEFLWNSTREGDSSKVNFPSYKSTLFF